MIFLDVHVPGLAAARQEYQGVSNLVREHARRALTVSSHKLEGVEVNVVEPLELLVRHRPRHRRVFLWKRWYSEEALR